MADTSRGVIRRYLAEAVKTEKEAESRFLAFAQRGDDAEVQGAFQACASQARLHHQRLSARVESLGETASSVKGFFDELFSANPRLGRPDSDEESVVDSLVRAFAMQQGQSAIYEVLANAAVAAGDSETETLARAIQADESASAAKLWHFLPSRSKIAFNLSTAGEIDPAIETKAPDDRIIG